jgi:hypothetical protein
MREKAKFAATNIRPSFCQFDAPLLTLTPLACSSLRPPLVQRRARLLSDGAACFTPPVEDCELKVAGGFSRSVAKRGTRLVSEMLLDRLLYQYIMNICLYEARAEKRRRGSPIRGYALPVDASASRISEGSNRRRLSLICFQVSRSVYTSI